MLVTQNEISLTQTVKFGCRVQELHPDTEDEEVEKPQYGLFMRIN